MAGQASGLFATTLFSGTCLLLSVVLFAIAMMANAPGEWGRGALTAYVAVVTAMIAGASSGALGGWVLALAFPGLVALVVGGPWGLLIAGAGVAALALVQALGGLLPTPIWLAPAIAIISIIPAIRALAS